MADIRLGTRGSALALAQTQLVVAALQAAHPHLNISVKTISTKGDKLQNVPLTHLGGQGAFAKDIENALLRNEIDVAVHCAKDLPATLQSGLQLSAYLPRADARDVLVINNNLRTETHGAIPLPHGASVGTGSLRRTAQLLAVRPDLHLKDVRGNVDTRLRKLQDGEFDALVLAGAGLARLGLLAQHKLVWLSSDIMLPAVAQGAIGLETRSDDAQTIALLAPINHTDTELCATAERAFLNEMGAGCQAPLAAYAVLQHSVLHLRGWLGWLDGSAAVRGECAGAAADAAQLGAHLAQQLIRKGGAAILQQSRVQSNILHGKRVVVTREAHKSRLLASKLHELGATPVMCPTISYEPPKDAAVLYAALHRYLQSEFDWLLFTSAQAVQVVADWVAQQPAQTLPGTKLAAIGDATAAACIQLLKQQPVLVPEQASARALLQALPNLKDKRVLLLNANLAGDALENQLRGMGANTARMVAYETVAAQWDKTTAHQLIQQKAHAILFASGSAVRFFAAQVDVSALRDVLVICIGSATAQFAKDAGFARVHIAPHASDEGLIEALMMNHDL